MRLPGVRLPDSLPASELMRQGAPNWQVMHAVMHLLDELADEHPRVVREALRDLGTAHTFVHTMDLGWPGWRHVLVAELESLERLLPAREEV